MASAALLLGTSACSGMLSGEQKVFVSSSRLQDKISQRFPMQRNVLGVSTVTLRNPRLSFDPDANRIGTRLDLSMPALFGLVPALDGSVDLAYGLRYDTTDNSVRMTNVQVKALDLRDAQGHVNSKISTALASVGEKLFQDYTLYKLTPDDLAKAAKYHYVPTGVTVRRDGLEVQLSPRP